MTVTSTSSNKVYTQYQSLIDGLKSGSIDYEAALNQTQQLASEARGNIAFIGKRVADLAKVDLPPETLAALRESLRTAMARSTVVQAYEKAQGPASEQPSQEIRSKAVSLLATIGTREMSDVHSQLNHTAYDFLSDYANTNRAAWSQTADELGITVAGQPQFFSVATSSTYDIGLDAPHSEAERIFRETASPEDIAKFDSLMAPKKQEIEDGLNERVLGMLELTSDRMEQFAPAQSIFEAAGVTSNDLSGVFVSRDQSGHYNVNGRGNKAGTIENLINSNPELRAFYDQQYAEQWRVGAK